MIVLDTNVVSELMRRRPSPAVRAWLDERSRSDLSLTAITIAELLYGVARLRGGARKIELHAAVEALIREAFSARVLPFDAGAAEHYAQLVAARERDGRAISIPDGQIAAICRRHGATLATRNTRDFEATGVELLDPWTEHAA